MAKLIEELIVIKLSKLIRDSDNSSTVLNDKQRTIIADNIDGVLGELLNEDAIVVELADLE